MQTWSCLYKKDKKKIRTRFGATSEADAVKFLLRTYQVNPDDILLLEPTGNGTGGGSQNRN